MAAEAAAAAIGAVTAAVGAAAGALVNTTLEAAALADEIDTMSTVTGMSTDRIQEWNYASELMDVSTETIAGAMTKLEKSMGSAGDAESELLDRQYELNQQLAAGEITVDEYNEQLGSIGTTYSQLGIDVLDANGNLRDSEDVFWDVIEALGEIDNETERDSVAMELSASR